MAFDRETEQLLDSQVMADIMASAVAEAPAVVEPAPVNEPLAATSTEVPPAAPAAVETKPETPVVETPPPTAEEELAFKHRGQEVKVKLTPEQKLEFIQKGYDYTAKTMELADFRRNAQEFIDRVRGEQQAQAEAVLSLLNDPDKLEAILNAKRAALGQAPRPTAVTPPIAEGDEFEPVSKSQLAQMLKDAETRIEAKVRAETAQAKGSVKEEIEYARMEEGYRGDFTSHVDTLIRQQFPVLAEFGGEGVSDKIREDAFKFVAAQRMLNPGLVIDPSQVKGVMTESAKRRAEGIEGKLREREKKTALTSAAVMEKGAEPRGGGAAPAPPAAKPLRLKDPALDAQVLREIESIMGKGA